MPIEKVYGIYHVDDLRATPPESHHAIKQVITNPSLAISKLGVEGTPEQIIRKGETVHVYWERVVEAARRRGINVVSLEPTKREQALTLFNGFLAAAVNEKAHAQWGKFRQRQLAESDKTEYAGSMRKMVSELEKEGGVTKELLRQTCLGVGYYRSLRMLERAEAENVSHLIVAHMHAEDFPRKRAPKPEMLGVAAQLTKKLAGLVGERQNSYQRQKKLVERLVRIAEKHFPND